MAPSSVFEPEPAQLSERIYLRFLSQFLPAGFCVSAHHYQHADVISIVIGDEECFAQDRLAVTVRDFSEEIVGGIRNEILHLFQIAAKLLNRFIPKAGIAGTSRLWPITFGPFRRDVIRSAAEFQDVPLRDSHVLEHLPGRVGQAFNLLTAGFGRKVRDEVIERDVRVAATQQREQMIAQ